MLAVPLRSVQETRPLVAYNADNSALSEVDTAMQFLPISDGNGKIIRWEGHNLTDGYSIIVTKCDDNSGYIARVLDLFTGESIHQLFGSTAMILWNTAVERMNKFSLYETLARG